MKWKYNLEPKNAPPPYRGVIEDLQRSYRRVIEEQLPAKSPGNRRALPVGLSLLQCQHNSTAGSATQDRRTVSLFTSSPRANTRFDFHVSYLHVMTSEGNNKSFLKGYFKKLPIGLIILLALFAGTIFLFTYLVHEVFGEQKDAVDQNIFNYLSAHVINARLTAFLASVTYFASARFLQIAYAVVFIFYLIIRNFKRAVEVIAIGAGGFIMNFFMKLAFHRVRPPHPLIAPLNNFSFPSGHATSGFIFYGTLAYLVWKTNISYAYKLTLGSILILFSLLIGFSRVYLRVHYPSDVVAGFCLGFGWLLLCIVLLERLKKETHIEQVSK
jgi:membrane-associated phospholipid phosphatase